MNFQDFINETKGQAIDVDGLYGCQCVDLFNYFNKLYNNCYINCQPSGYAKSLAENKNNNEILKYYKETDENNLVEGTVVVYGNCSFAPNSHVCFFIKDNGNGTYQALQQNAGGKQYVTIDDNTYSGIIGYFIPNQLINSNTSNNEIVDQILHKGSKVKFNKIFKVDIIKSPISNNLFGCSELTGCTYEDYKNENVKDYHWLSTIDFDEVDKNGNKTSDQILQGGISYVKNDNTYEVLAVDKKTDSAKICINSHNSWVFCKYLDEV